MDLTSSSGEEEEEEEDEPFHFDASEWANGHHEASDDQDDDNSDDAGVSDEQDSDEFYLARPRHGLIDDEAEESGSEHDSPDGSHEPYRGYNKYPEKPREQTFFPQFPRLPHEIRAEIWALFCPALTARGCVFEVVLCSTQPQPWRLPYGVAENPLLAMQTKSIRTLLSTNRESRAMGYRRFPHRLRLDCPDQVDQQHGLLPFHQDKDVILVSGLLDDMHLLPDHPLPGFTDVVRHLSIPIEPGDRLEDLDRWLATFQRLRAIYLRRDVYELLDSTGSLIRRRLGWCGSPLVNHYIAESREIEAGFGEDLDIAYCWPDLEHNRSFAVAHIGGPQTWTAGDRAVQLGLRAILDSKGVEIWPMAEFMGPDQLAALEFLASAYENPDLWDPAHIGESNKHALRPTGRAFALPRSVVRDESDEEDDDEDDDEDADSDEDDSLDGFIAAEDEVPDETDQEDVDSSDSNDVAEVDGNRSPSVVESDDEESSTFDGFSSAHGNASEPGDVAARFSSPEPVRDEEASSTNDGNSDPMASRRRKRRVVDSEDEEGDHEAGAEEVAGGHKRRRVAARHVIDSDDSDL